MVLITIDYMFNFQTGVDDYPLGRNATLEKEKRPFTIVRYFNTSPKVFTFAIFTSMLR